MSCACHWAVNQAATDSAGRMWGHAYSVFPAASYVRPDSEVRRPEDLAGVEVAVGYHSGSHFSTIQALEPFMSRVRSSLRFGGMPYDRVDALLAGEVPAAAVWSGARYLLEQQGAARSWTRRSWRDSCSTPTPTSRTSEVLYALKRAQMDLDLAPSPTRATT